MTLFGFITLSLLIVVAVGWILYNFGKMRVVSANGRNYPSKNYVYDYFGSRRLNESVMRAYGSEFRRYAIYNNDNIVIHRWGYLNDRVVEELEGYPVLVVDCFPEKVFCLCKYVGWCNN